MSCAICEKRKEKRFCPAVHGRICAQCCGENREVTLDCPSDCIYLQQARQHERNRPLGDLDHAALFPRIEISEQFIYQHEPLLLGLNYALMKGAGQERAVFDGDLIAALTAVAARYETLVNTGLYYQTRLSHPAQQLIAEALDESVKGFRDTEKQNVGYARLRDSEILHTLVFLIRMAYSMTSGRPKSRAFFDFLAEQVHPAQGTSLLVG